MTGHLNAGIKHGGKGKDCEIPSSLRVMTKSLKLLRHYMLERFLKTGKQ
jgi:hypothetical protein